MKIEKAFAISNARISFVSLVNKAANKRRFLITKADGDRANFTSCGRIVKADADNHYVTGIVYEPMAEDTDGNYMTEDEITKAAYWYNKNGDKVDIQHSFQPTDGASVVESWIAKADFDINGQHIRKGTWLMTMEVTDSDLWNEIRKGTITGFSMGGVGEYSDVDEDIRNLTKSDDTEAKSLFAKLGRALGLSVVEKGRVTDEYKRQAKNSAFWAAFDSLKAALNFDYGNIYETDETKIRTALQEFNDIIVELLNSPDPVYKAIKPRKETETERNDESNTPEAEPDNVPSDEEKKPEREETPPEQDEPEEEEKDKDKEEATLTKAEIEQIAAAVAKAINPANPTEDVTKAADGDDNSDISAEAIQQMVEQAVTKAIKPEKPAVTAADVQTMIDTAVEKAVSAVMKSRNNPSNLNGNSAGKAEPAEHYMHGIL